MVYTSPVAEEDMLGTADVDPFLSTTPKLIPDSDLFLTFGVRKSAELGLDPGEISSGKDSSLIKPGGL